MTSQDRRDAPASDPAIRNFLGIARRRHVVAGLLAGSVLAAVVNEALRWISVGYVLLAGRPIPVLDFGPFVLLALWPILRRRWTPAATARHADAALGLHDRLGTFLDLAGRGDVDPGFRRAQAAEAARSIRGLRPEAAVPLPWRLWAGPVLLAVSVLYPLILVAGVPTVTKTAVRRLVAPSPRDPRLARVAAPGKTAKPGPAGADAPAPADAPPEPEAPVPGPAADGAHGGPGAGEGDGQQRSGRRRPEPRVQLERPSEIISERVGTGLVPVVDPLFAPAAQPPAASPAPRGTMAFHLLPRSDRAGAGEGNGETQAAERVTVDFDALPEQYRTLVRAYYEGLAGPRE